MLVLSLSRASLALAKKLIKIGVVYKLTGLGLPGKMAEYLKDGTREAMFRLTPKNIDD